MGSSAKIAAVTSDSHSAKAAPAGMRERMPALGLREYWYPALLAKKVGTRRPKELKIAGEDLVFFRDASNEVVALARACPHRGAFLSHGKSHFKGTLTCPYHGWTFDGKGHCLAVLGEGPASKIPGSPGSQARCYPTRTIRGVVFVWMGQGKPAPIEQDVPPELFGDAHLVMTAERVWKANWRPSIENFSDAHVYYLHRNSIEMITQPPAALYALAHSGPARPQLLRINDRALVYDPKANTVLNYADRAAEESGRETRKKQRPHQPPFQDTYPSLGGQKWPPTRTRLYISRICGFFRGLFPPSPPMTAAGTEWSMGVHLPCTIRVDYRRLMFTRFQVPIDEGRTNNFYFLAVRRRNLLNQLFWKAYVNIYYRWKVVGNFSTQDGAMAEIVDYTTPERLSPTDKFPLEWRRFVVECARTSVVREEPSRMLPGETLVLDT
jgi:phenylpropionate dioxygenase-like ring-hydroxylating dioxygenase large terminal subunit